MSKYPIRSLGYWLEKKKKNPGLAKKIPVLASSTGFDAISQFEESTEGLTIMCEDYLRDCGDILSKNDLVISRKIEKARDVHSFMEIGKGSYEGNFLHLQAYIGTSSEKVFVFGCIKYEPIDDTANVGSSFQNFYEWYDFEKIQEDVERLLNV